MIDVEATLEYMKILDLPKALNSEPASYLYDEKAR
jgi:hypothetical protein